jgi:hypothetical protein
MRLRNRFRLRGLAVGVVIGLAVGGSIAYAAIPDSPSGQISACYPTSGPDKGKLSVIDASAGQSCGAGEAALSWQQRPLCDDWPHPGVDYSMPGSTPGNGCNFVGLAFPGGDATNGDFTDANLTGAVLDLNVTGANFTGADLTGANLSYANLTHAKFTNAALGGVTWSSATCPDGTHANSHGNTCAGHLTG